MINKETKVVVLMGGPSTEAEVSRNTGTAIAGLLAASIGYHVIPMEYDPHHVVENLKAAGASGIYCLHGKYGEDGTIQSVLELARIPYTGSRSLPLPLLWIKS